MTTDLADATGTVEQLGQGVASVVWEGRDGVSWIGVGDLEVVGEKSE